MCFNNIKEEGIYSAHLVEQNTLNKPKQMG